MKQRRMAALLVVLLCAAALSSGVLLILHTDHECHQAACPVCMMLARGGEPLECLLIAWAGMSLWGDLYRRCLCALPENRFVPDWTPVRRKVKMQD